MKKASLFFSSLAPLAAFAADANESATKALEQVTGATTVAADVASAIIKPELNAGNTAWVLAATALVMLMTPAGLALFYGGMTRSKNLLNTIAMSFMAYAIASIVWVCWGYSLAFSGTEMIGGVLGDLANAFMGGITLDGNTTAGIWCAFDDKGKITTNYGIPTMLFAAFQMTFAAIAIALVSGSIIDRLKFSTWIIFCVLWVTVVYSPIAHLVWGGGFLTKAGTLDFAGGTVVHINAGIAGLVVALMLGKRKDANRAMFPSSVAFTVLGAAMLWFGWFGFNAGSELGADGIAANAFIVTNTAAAIGAIAWMIVEYVAYKKYTLIGMASGAVAGLVAITPAAGFVGVGSSLIIGALAGIIGFVGVNGIKRAFKYDDSLDAFGVHALCGIWGAIATGVFADPAINSAGKGLLFGNPGQMLVQIEAVAVTIVYTAVATAIVYGISSLITGGGRVNAEEESLGLDETQHGEKAFHL